MVEFTGMPFTFHVLTEVWYISAECSTILGRHDATGGCCFQGTEHITSTSSTLGPGGSTHRHQKCLHGLASESVAGH